MTSDTWQLLFVDGLFLCIACGLGLWFRRWINAEKEAIDRRLQGLEEHQAHLERISNRLQTLCSRLELQVRLPAAREEERLRGEGRFRRGDDGQEDRYERAWQLLAQGQTPEEVARSLQLGLAEVELMGRVLRYRRRAP